MFAAGDVRLGSVKRVASAVGEGAATVPLVHRPLNATPASSLVNVPTPTQPSMITTQQSGGRK